MRWRRSGLLPLFLPSSYGEAIEKIFFFFFFFWLLFLCQFFFGGRSGFLLEFARHCEIKTLLFFLFLRESDDCTRPVVDHSAEADALLLLSLLGVENQAPFLVDGKIAAMVYLPFSSSRVWGVSFFSLLSRACSRQTESEKPFSFPPLHSFVTMNLVSRILFRFSFFFLCGLLSFYHVGWVVERAQAEAYSPFFFLWDS